MLREPNKPHVEELRGYSCLVFPKSGTLKTFQLRCSFCKIGVLRIRRGLEFLSDRMAVAELLVCGDLFVQFQSFSNRAARRE